MIFAYSSVNSGYSSIKKGYSSGSRILFAGSSKVLILNRFKIPDTCLYVSIWLFLVKFWADSDFCVTIACVIETFFVPLRCRRIWGNVRTSPERNDNGGHISLCFEVRGLLSGFFSHLFSFQTDSHHSRNYQMHKEMKIYYCFIKKIGILATNQSQKKRVPTKQRKNLSDGECTDRYAALAGFILILLLYWLGCLVRQWELSTL